MIKFLLSLLIISFSAYTLAAEDSYSSVLVNESKQAGSNGFILAEDKKWPSPECIIESTRKIIKPGESSELKIKKTQHVRRVASAMGYMRSQIKNLQIN